MSKLKIYVHIFDNVAILVNLTIGILRLQKHEYVWATLNLTASFIVACVYIYTCFKLKGD